MTTCHPALLGAGGSVGSGDMVEFMTSDVGLLLLVALSVAAAAYTALILWDGYN